MDLIHKFLNLAVPPITFFFLCLFLPPYWTFRFFLFIINSIFPENVAGKVVHITGASSGIGEVTITHHHLAYEYAKRGARLAPSARRETALREVADRARDYGSPDVIIIRADVSKVADCSRLVDETLNHFGRLDHLVNNAAISDATLFEEADDITNFRPIMDTNFWGSVYTTRFALPHLKKSRGKIVAMSSADSWMSFPRKNVYNASKAALVSMYETLRVEVGSHVGITIVTPCYIESEITKEKFLLAEGKMDLHQDLRDVEVSAMPVGSVSECAKAILNSTLRGDTYLTMPAWFRMTYALKVLCPELVEWSLRILYLTSLRSTPAREVPTKKILDVTGVKKLIYPSSIQSPDGKTE
ncbi:11-beta-hydroxysteroid dehydrogenase 1B, partial [Mucuna pruriens]